MAKPIKGKDGKFQGSIGEGREQVPSPSPVPTAPAASTDVNTAAGQVEAAYERFQNTQPSSVRQGAAMPGTPYTGMRVEYRNPQTGHVRTEWSGELHGTWEGDVDPASELLSNVQGTSDGYLPYRAVLSAPHADLPNTWSERDVNLMGGETRRIAERLHYRDR